MRPIIVDFSEPDGEIRFGSVMRSLFGNIRQHFTNLGRPEARLVSSPFGRCQLSVLEACRHDVTGGDRSDRRSYDPDSIEVAMQVRGKGRFSQMGNTTNLYDGSFVLYDPTLPYSFVSETAVHMVLLQLPRKLFSCRADMPGDLLQIHGSGTSGLPHVLASMLISAGVGIECLDDDPRKSIGEALISLVCALANVGAETEAEDSISANILHQRIVRFVQEHLQDPDLSLDSIAAALRCSKRYLHRTFENESITLERYIWNTRLERCRETLMGDHGRRLSLSQVAFSVGFNSSAHFSRAFKQRYGMTPREFRHLGDTMQH